MQYLGNETDPGLGKHAGKFAFIFARLMALSIQGL